MQKDLLVSIVIPVRHRPSALGACLQAIEDQQFEHRELVLVHDETSAGMPEIPEGSDNVRVIASRVDRRLSRMINAGMTAARGHVRVLLMPECVPTTADWLDQMLAPLDDPDVGVSVSSCRYPENAEMSLGGCLLNAVSPVQQCHEAADSGDAPAVSHLADAYRAELLADIGYFEDECLRSPGEAVELTLRVEDAGYAIVQAEHATVEYRASKSEASVRTAIGRAVDYGFSDAVLEARYGMRWINSGIFAAALLSLVLLPLAFLSMKAATAVSLAILVWGFFLGVQLPRIKWELPVAALNFAAWATVIWFIRDDWWPELFGREIHPSLVRQWCWFGAVTASYLLLVGKAALGSAWRTCRGRCGLRYALPVLALSPVWWLAAGVGYAHGRLVAPGGD